MNNSKFIRFWQEIHGPERWEVAVHILLIWFLALIVFLFLHSWLPKIVQKKLGKRGGSRWITVLANNKILTKLGVLILIATFGVMLPLVKWEGITALRKVTAVSFIVMSSVFVTSLIRAANGIYEGYSISRTRPIKLFAQTFEVVIYCIALIFIVSIIASKSLHNLFVGLGAFAAVLMLVFKDSITGFVAGIQLNANDMVRLGDWIVVENCSANGLVEEINLYTVKVRNWDMTISMVPTYQLVSSPFINWRGMFDGEGRRIMQNVYVDARSVHFISNEELERLKSSPYLGKYMEKMGEQAVKSGAVTTNLTLFRNYMEEWMVANSDLNIKMMYMVRELPSSPTGIPVQFYCFTKEKHWVGHEHIAADMFDHIYAVLSEFSLHVYEYTWPSWRQ